MPGSCLGGLRAPGRARPRFPFLPGRAQVEITVVRKRYADEKMLCMIWRYSNETPAMEELAGSLREKAKSEAPVAGAQAEPRSPRFGRLRRTAQRKARDAARRRLPAAGGHHALLFYVS